MTGEHKIVCVTGAAGYVGTHVVRELLGRGYRVRGAVRDAKNEAGTAHLRQLPGAKERLELHSADLLRAGAYDEPFAGCDYICHCAAAVRFAARNPQRDIVDPAVIGSSNALASARAAKTVKRMVVTSSIAAVASLNMPLDYVFTEADWTIDANLKETPYELAKTTAEQRMWREYKQTPAAQRFGLVTINPGYVLGPIHNETHLRSSPTVIADLLRRTYPGCPRFAFSIVDVRDVAHAHVEALEREAASGRYLLVNETASIQQVAQLMARRFPDRRIPQRELPDFLIYLAALFDQRLSFGTLKHHLNKKRRYDGSRATRELGISYRPLEQSLVDTGNSIVALGLA